jgi:hypothetical protein
MVERAFEEGWLERGTGWGREDEGKDGEGKEEKEVERDRPEETNDERSWERSVSTLLRWINDGAGGARR